MNTHGQLISFSYTYIYIYIYIYTYNHISIYTHGVFSADCYMKTMIFVSPGVTRTVSRPRLDGEQWRLLVSLARKPRLGSW